MRLALASALVALGASAPLSAQVTSHLRSVEASAYFLDPFFGEDPSIDSESKSTTAPGSFVEHADATVGSFGSVSSSKADQFGTIDPATGSFNVHGYAFAQLYVQGDSHVEAGSLAELNFTLVEPGSVAFSDGDLSTYDSFLGQQTHDRPGQASAEVRIESVPSGTVVYLRRVEMGQPGTSLQEEVVELAPGTYRLVLRADASDATNGIEEIVGSVAASTFDIVGTISGLGELDTTPPASPTGLNAVAGNQVVNLSWNVNEESDLAGYRLRRSTTSGGPYEVVADVATASATDATVTNGVTYFYVVTAVDTSNNESALSAEVAAIPTAPADTTPPAPPTGLNAVAGNQTVSLSWNVNEEPDVASYRLRRSTVSGGPYDVIADVATAAANDTAVTNGVTYFYVATAIDTSNNESAPSAEVAATPTAPVATSVHVASIQLTTQPAPGNKLKAVALVTVVDSLGVPRAGVVVAGSFAGKPAGAGSAVTDASGVATMASAAVKAPLAFTFCVTSVSHGSLPYASSENVETCDTF